MPGPAHLGPDSWYAPAANAPAVNAAMPIRLCVPCRCPPDSFLTSQEKPSVRNPNEPEIEVSWWSMSGSTPAPAQSAIPAARCASVTCRAGASPAKTSAPLSA